MARRVFVLLLAVLALTARAQADHGGTWQFVTPEPDHPAAPMPYCQSGPKSEFQKSIEKLLRDSLRRLVQRQASQAINLPSAEIASRLGLPAQTHFQLTDILRAIEARGQDVLAPEDRVWLQRWADAQLAKQAPTPPSQTPGEFTPPPGSLGSSSPQPLSPQTPAVPPASPQSPGLQSLSDAYTRIASARPGAGFFLRQGLNRKLGLPRANVSARQIAQALRDPNVLARLSPSEISRLRSAAAHVLGGLGSNPGSPGDGPHTFGPSPDTVTPLHAGTSPGVTSPGSGGVPQQGHGFVLDERVRATQQYADDCWAHSYGVALQLALLGPSAAPAHTQPRSAYLDLASRSGDQDFASVLAQYGPQAVGQEIQRQGWYGARGFLLPSRNHFTFGGRDTEVGVSGNPLSSERVQQLLARARGAADQLSQMTGGGPTPEIPQVIGFASQLGWNRYVAMRAVGGQDEDGVAGVISTIIDGMKHGVRFSGYFNHQHAMAILGADLNSNSIWVTDSMQNGRILKIPLDTGRLHLDGMVGVVRRDLPDGASWLDNQQPLS